MSLVRDFDTRHIYRNIDIDETSISLYRDQGHVKRQWIGAYVLLLHIYVYLRGVSCIDI